MSVLVVYATVEGHTAKIARAVAAQIERAGHIVNLTDVREPGYAIPGEFDAVFVCGPLHMGDYPPQLREFARNFSAALNNSYSGLVTVSLSAASEHAAERADAATCADKFCQASGWTPRMRHDAAGAIKYIEYNYFKRLIMRRIVAQAGGPTDITNDYELTDWDALSAFVDEFLARAFDT